ncbi:MAG TPA: response regulator transcription factor [Acidobacteriota bacterium]|jgi:DNA-binding NarL/FixJ family response regulator
MPLRIVLAEDHLILSQCLKACLELEGFEVVGQADDGHQAVRLTEKLHPDVVVLDLAMPNLNGLDAARRIRDVAPQTKKILLTMYTEDHYLLEALQAGVRGYVLKSQSAQDLVQAIKEVWRGGIYLSPRISRAIVDAYLNRLDFPSNPLTPREREVLQLVAEGRTSKEVASILEIGVKTAESHRSRIMEKLNIHDTAGLVRYAIRQGIVQP